MSLDANKVILGTYGYLYIDGQWQTNINHLEASVGMEKRELLLSGDAWKRYKNGPMKGIGAMSGFKVTSAMLQKGFEKYEIISKLDDPESYGHERIRLKNVMADALPLANWKAGEEVTEAIKFTFEEYELLDPIVAS